MFNANQVKNDLVQWIREWFQPFGDDSKAVVGISGGVDSSVVAALCVEALGRERVVGVMMPDGEQADISDSYKLVKHLGIKSVEINIREATSSIVKEMALSYIEVSEQSMVNLPPRIRMATLYAVAQSVNGFPSCNCNLSEDWIGYSTYGGDDFGSFGPLRNLTKTEVIAIGDALGLPYKLVHKAPADGLCGKTDEENFGFSYIVLDRYIRTGEIEDMFTKKRIDTMHEKNKFKMQPMDTFPYVA